MGDRVQLTLQTLAQGFIFALQVEGKVPSTVSYYQSNLRRFLWYAVQHNWPEDPRSINPLMLREFLAYAGNAKNRWGARGNGSENCREPSKTGGWRYYRTLRALFRWAIAEKLLEQNPLANIKVNPPKEQPPKPYSSEELRRLIAVCDIDSNNSTQFIGCRNKAIILLYVTTGQRLSELGNLKLDDFSLETGRGIVNGKGGWQRQFAIQPIAKKALWKYIALRERRVKPSAEDWLWITEEGLRLSVDGIHIAFRRIKKRAGVNGFGAVHRLRHTFALNALRELKDPFLLQLLLGHRTLEMTRRYTQELKIEEALNAMDHTNLANRLGLG
jgi:site-specific recombinase XerD